MHLSEHVFKYKPVFYFILISLVLGGIYSFIKIGKLEDPEIQIKQANVITIYPGASAHEVELQVTNIIENELMAMADLEVVESKSIANMSQIAVKLELSVPDHEVEQRWDMLRRRVARANDLLPSNAQNPIIVDDFGDVYGMFYAMTSDGFSNEEMFDYAKKIKRELLKINSVRRVEIYGNLQPCINIVLSKDQMANLGITPTQIITAVKNRNKMVYAGSYTSNSKQFRLAVDEKIKNTEHIENILIQSFQDEQIRLGDIATITKAYQEPIRNTMYLNNKQALGISISAESGENIVKVGKEVEKEIARLQKEIPTGIEFEKVFFQPDKVNDAIGSFMLNLTESVLIVIIVLMFTMGVRSGLIIGSGLLLTIVATFPVLYMSDGSLQRVSLGAFIVAMGMLVDNAIVVLDGISMDLKRNVPRKIALTQSAKKTALPLLGATVIAAAAFLPVFLSPDTAGVYTRDLFVVLAISLIISWILALTQVPVFSSKLITIKKKNNKKDLYDTKIYKVYKKLLIFSLKNKFGVITITILLLTISLLGFSKVKRAFFPDFNYEQVYIEYSLPDGTSPNKVISDLNKITEYILSFKEVEMVVSSHGMTPTRYCLVRAMGEPADNYGELIVNFTNYNTMLKMKPVLEKYLYDNYPDAYTRIRKYNLSIKATHTVEAQFSGPDPAVLKKLSKKAENIMKNSKYVEKHSVNNDWNPMSKSLWAQYSQAVATRLGTTRSDVGNALLASNNGLPIGTVFQGENKLPIYLKTRNNDQSQIKEIKDIPVWNMIPGFKIPDKEYLIAILNGSKNITDIQNNIIHSTPLSQISKDIELRWEESLVRRANGERTIQAQCEPLNGYSPAVVRKDILKQIEQIKIPEGYSFKWMGEYELQNTALDNIINLMPVAAIIILLILILLFNDYKKPIIIIFSLPLVFIGIVPGLILTGKPFSFVAIVGTMGLMGMMIKNGIVLIDEIGAQIKEGKKGLTAIYDASVSRVRPVILASFTTILGMIPLVNDPMYGSLAVTVMFGLLIGTLITLVITPVAYSILFKVSIKTKN